MTVILTDQHSPTKAKWLTDHVCTEGVPRTYVQKCTQFTIFVMEGQINNFTNFTFFCHVGTTILPISLFWDVVTNFTKLTVFVKSSTVAKYSKFHQFLVLPPREFVTCVCDSINNDNCFISRLFLCKLLLQEKREVDRFYKICKF